jgi:hypothetical protein
VVNRLFRGDSRIDGWKIVDEAGTVVVVKKE